MAAGGTDGSRDQARFLYGSLVPGVQQRSRENHPRGERPERVFPPMTSPACDGPCILLDACGGDFARAWRFRGHVATLQAMEAADVAPLLAKVESSAAEGHYAAGFISYEAGSAINPDLPSHPPLEGLPLAWFAIFRERVEA